MALHKICIAGLGLMGASWALAARSARGCHITAVDREEELSRLRNAGLADRVESLAHLPELAAKSDLLILAAPVEAIPELIDSLKGHLGERTLVTDLGGVKGRICAEAEKALGGSCFIGGHPMCGSETSGHGKADPFLFRGAPYVLCPLPGVRQEALLSLMSLVEAIGAHPVILDPGEHDRLVALISHLPQILANTLMRTVSAAVNDRELALKIAGRGFRDMTRIAASDYRQWEGVLDMNEKQINEALDEFTRTLTQARGELNEGKLSEAWNEAAALRRKIADRSLA